MVKIILVCLNGMHSGIVICMPESLKPPAINRSKSAVASPGEAAGDPYRWLGRATDPETAAWVTAQNEPTRAWLAAVPARAQIRCQLGKQWNHARFGVPFERGGRWFQTRNSGLQAQPVLYVMDAPLDEGRVLIDPNAASDEGTVALGAISVSPDGSKVAYATAVSGSDWLTWHVRDVESGADKAGILEWSKSEDAEWAKDGSGFYYAAMAPPRPGGEYQDATAGKRIFFHRTGTPQRDDELVFAPADAAIFPEVAVTPDGRYLVVSLSRGIGPGAELRVRDLDRRQAGWRVLVPDGGDLAQVVTSQGTTFYLLTDDGADRRRIVAIDLERPGRPHWREVLPEADDTLLEAHFFGGRLVCHYLRGACSLLLVAELDGTFVRDIPLPAMSTLGGNQLEHELIEGRPGSDIIYFEMVSFTSPAALYRHDLRSGETTVVHAPAGALDQREFITERVAGEVSAQRGDRAS
jgi:prolyl oligopeptidase